MPIGYTNHVPCIRIKAAIRGNHQLPSVAAMLSFRMRVPSASLRNIEAGKCYVRPTRLKLKKVPAWRDHKHLMPDITMKGREHIAMPSEVSCKPASLKLVCPKCPGQREVANKNLLRGSKWCMLHCNLCHRSTNASRWRCSCGCTWYSCSSHAKQGYACGRDPDISVSTYGKSKTAKSMCHQRFPCVHSLGSEGQPSTSLQKLVNEHVWQNMPNVQYQAKLKKQKCSSQQQYSVIDNVAVFTVSGTNARRPDLKRSLGDEREDLLEAIKRRRGQALELVDFKLPDSNQRGIKNQHVQQSNDDGANGSKQSALERMQAKFRAKFAKTQHIQQQTSCSSEEPHPSPQQGQMGVTTLNAEGNTQASRSSPDFQHAGSELETRQAGSRYSNQPSKIKWVQAKKPSRPGVRVAGVAWGPKAKPKPHNS